MAIDPEHQRFIHIALKEFDFLVKDFGFIATPDTGLGAGVSFTNQARALKISCGWYKGEIDFQFEVLLENEIFRPYISRRFGLGEIANHIDSQAIAMALSERPPRPEWILSA